MAINISDKQSLVEQILPRVDILVTASGLQIISEDRLRTPRFVQFDISGKCRSCKSDSVDVDFVVSRDGVSLYCSRIKKPKFIPFDIIYDLPSHCIFRLKSRGRVFNIPYGETTGHVSTHQADDQGNKENVQQQGNFAAIAEPQKQGMVGTADALAQGQQQPAAASNTA